MKTEIKYLKFIKPITKEEALQLSEELFNLSRPKHLRDPKDVTTHLFGVTVHPTTGEVVFQTSTEQLKNGIFIHEESDPEAVGALMQKFFNKKNDAEGLEENVKGLQKNAINLIMENKGRKVKIEDIFPFKE